jgi:hypothetical protein
MSSSFAGMMCLILTVLFLLYWIGLGYGFDIVFFPLYLICLAFQRFQAILSHCANELPHRLWMEF